MGWNSVPENLCHYMRRLVVWGLVTGALGAAAAFLIAVPVLSAVFWIISGVMPTGMWLAVPSIEFGVFLVVSLCIGIGLLNDYLGQMHIFPKGSMTDNIVYQYGKAVHDKVCPTIDFTD